MWNEFTDSSKTKKYALLGVASLFMTMVVYAEAVNYSVNSSRKTAEIHRESKLVIRRTAVTLICSSTDYKSECTASLATVRSSDPRNLIRAAFDLAIASIRSGIDKGIIDLDSKAEADVQTREALNSCRELMDSAIDDLRRTRDKFGGFLFTRLSDFVEDLCVWLSGSITYQQTCIDGFEGIDSDAAVIMEKIMRRGQHLTSNGLAIASNLDKLLKAFRIPIPFLGSRRGGFGLLGSGSSKEQPSESPEEQPSDSSENAPAESDSSENSSKKSDSSENSPAENDSSENSKKKSDSSENAPAENDSSENSPKKSVSSENQTLDSSKDPPKKLDSSENRQSDSSENRQSDSSKSKQSNPSENQQSNSSEDQPSQDSSSNQASGSSKNPSTKDRHLWEEGEFPPWVTLHSRRLLAARGRNIRANAVVAKDGSGKFKTIAQALAMVPQKNTRKFVIYIKQGVYTEKVEVTKKMLNVMFIGDGPTKTIITGNIAFLPDHIGTYRTATVAVNGDNFVAKDIGFENTAGAARHQAVALRVSADFAVFYNCRMDGYQDTLYVHTHRQFYRDCRISGTIDFVFGDAKAVFQNCEFVIRRPMDNQQCIVTAQGRKDRRETTGIVIHNSRIIGDASYRPVKAKNRAFLGRPWKEYSRTIIMNTEIDDVIDPEGWLKWNETFALNTLFYTEYQNKGRGSGQARRVRWKGIRKISDRDAKEFSPGNFLRGNRWVPQTGVPYNPN